MAYSTIKDPSAHFQTKIYTGNNADTHAITNDGNSDLQPDLVWIKRRDYDNQHVLHDTSRGVTKFLSTDNTTNAEGTISPTTKFQSFDTDGFTTGSTSGAYNASGEPFVAWQWKVNGGTTSSNTDGTLSSTVQVNSDAGFSIQTLTSASSGTSNWGHGLGQKPDFWTVKITGSGGGGWWSHHKSLTSGTSSQYIGLHSTAAATNLSAFDANSSTITASADFVANNKAMYCWAFVEKQGYSKFGKYTGTGNRSSARFVYTGFKPALVIVRCSSTTGHWLMIDSARNPYNGDFDYLRANNVGAEENSGLSFVDPIDFLSNGFSVLNYDAWMNGGGNTYIYMAFAESPFVAGGIPTTAR